MQKTGGKIKVLFLCTGNSCRSQMAEGWAKRLLPDSADAYSAGIDPHGLDPRAIEAMREAGVDISAQRSKHVDELNGIEFDLVVTVCGHANEHCPVFPKKVKVIHAGFDDPPRLTRDSRNDAEALIHYRRIRDEIRDFILKLPDILVKDKQINE